jgi:hypothetical protein
MNESVVIVCPPSAPPPAPPPDFQEWSAGVPFWFWAVFCMMAISSLVGIFGVCAFAHMMVNIKKRRHPVALDETLSGLERRLAERGL